MGGTVLARTTMIDVSNPHNIELDSTRADHYLSSLTASLSAINFEGTISGAPVNL